MKKLHHKKCKKCGVEKTLNFFQLKKGSFSDTCSWCESQKLLKQLKLIGLNVMTDKHQFIEEYLKKHPNEDDSDALNAWKLEVKYINQFMTGMNKLMTPEQKIEALTDLLSNVIHSLEMTQYDIENPELSYASVLKADDYHAQMIKILHE